MDLRELSIGGLAGLSTGIVVAIQWKGSLLGRLAPELCAGTVIILYLIKLAQNLSQQKNRSEVFLRARDPRNCHYHRVLFSDGCWWLQRRLAIEAEATALKEATYVRYEAERWAINPEDFPKVISLAMDQLVMHVGKLVYQELNDGPKRQRKAITPRQEAITKVASGLGFSFEIVRRLFNHWEGRRPPP